MGNLGVAHLWHRQLVHGGGQIRGLACGLVVLRVGLNQPASSVQGTIRYHQVRLSTKVEIYLFTYFLKKT